MSFIKKYDGEPPKPEIATKDIEVYKYSQMYEYIIGKYACPCNAERFYSNVFLFKYITNKKNKTVPLKPKLSTLYKTKTWIKYSKYARIPDCKVIYIEKGYYSYETPDNIKAFLKEWRESRTEDLFIYYIGTFIIPKGSKYYKNNDGEVISSNLIYTGKYEKIKF